MKKIFSILLVAVLLTLSLCAFIPSISAAEDDWVLGPYAEYVTHSGETYYPLESRYCINRNYDKDYYYRDLEFADEETEKRYKDSSVSVYAGAENVAVAVELYSERNGYQNRFYIGPSHIEEYEKLAEGISDNYVLYNDYLYYETTETFKFTPEVLETWRQGSVETLSLDSVFYRDHYYLYARDELGAVEVECAMVIRDYYTDELYLLWYNEYDSSFFLNDGTLDSFKEADVNLYKLEDEVLREEIITYLDTEPEDELDWLVVEKVNETAALVFCSIVFGVLPLAAFVFSVTMLFVLKDKKYIRPYAVIAAGSLLVILAFVAVLLILI